MKLIGPARIALLVVVCLYALVSALPLLWMVGISIRSPQEAFKPTLLPSVIKLSNYAAAAAKFRLSIGNSLVVAMASTAISVTLGFLAGYGLSRCTFRGKSIAGTVLLSARLLPPVLLVVGLFIAFQRVHLYDSLTAVILADTLYTLPFSVWMLRNYFDAIPQALDEAALVDGASLPAILSRVMLPLAGPGVMATVVYCFLLAWNDLLYALTFVLSNERKLVTVIIAEQSGEWWTNYPEMMAMATLFTVPIVALFLAVQRSLVTGLGAGALKS